MRSVFVTVGRTGVAAVTVLYGLFFISCAFNGLGQLNAPEGYVSAYGGGPGPDTVTGARVLVGWLSMMGITSLASAYCLIPWRPRAFAVACIVMAAAHLSLLAYGLIGVGHFMPLRTLSFGWVIFPPLLLAAAAWVFRFVDGGRAEGPGGLPA